MYLHTRYAQFYWCSKLQIEISFNTMDAKYIAFSQTIGNTFYVQFQRPKMLWNNLLAQKNKYCWGRLEFMVVNAAGQRNGDWDMYLHTWYAQFYGAVSYR